MSGGDAAVLPPAWKALNEEIIECRACPRLVAWREQVAAEKRRAYADWDYWGRPVTGFGDVRGRLLIVGLAPGAHGSNRTGRMFTGDSSGVTLFGTLFRTGFANQPTSADRYDGLALQDAFVTAVVRCVPPGNRPKADELANCRRFLERELDLMPQVQVVVALGKIGFDNFLNLLRARGQEVPSLKFSHGLRYSLSLDGREQPVQLLASYHPSRQNTQTGRLTLEMFDSVFAQARQLLDQGSE